MSAPERSLAALRALAASTPLGLDALPEAAWREVAAGGPTVVSCADAAAVVFPSDSFTPSRPQVGVLAAPGAPTPTIAAVVADAVAATPNRPVVAWVPGAARNVVAGLEAAGFREDRRQLQMQAPLPVAAPVWPEGVTITAFRPGVDDAAWLVVNNRAFANHPDQGDWIEETLQRRLAESWFDPAGFLLAWRGADLAGFCWTKVHPGAAPVGEIFVIGVDPDAQGIGLGRALVLGGLEHLARVRGCRTGLLYVAADNVAARALYESIGFRVTRTDTALVLA